MIVAYHVELDSVDAIGIVRGEDASSVADTIIAEIREAYPGEQVHRFFSFEETERPETGFANSQQIDELVNSFFDVNTQEDV